MNTYLHENELGRVNAWEYYFCQPGGLSLDEAHSCRKYIVGRDAAWHKYPGYTQSGNFFRNENGKLNYWRNICRKYIRFSPAVLERLERMKQKYSGRKILGLLLRGTDYTYIKPKGHPVQPEPDEAISKALEAMQIEGFNSVYLATEDKRILKKCQDAFGEKLLLPDCEYIDYDYNNPKFLHKYISNDKYKMGLDYVVSIAFLSRCPGFITSITSGSTGVMCLSEGFEYLYVFDLGVYQ